MLLPASVAERHEELFQTFVNTGEPSDVLHSGREIQGLRKDGSLITLSLLVVHGGEGDSRFFAAYLRGACVCMCVVPCLARMIDDTHDRGPICNQILPLPAAPLSRSRTSAVS